MTSPPRSILRGAGRDPGAEEGGSTRKCVQFANTENSTPRFSNGGEERFFAKSIVAPPDEEDWNLPFKPMAELRSEEDDVIEISPPQNLEIDIGDFMPSNWSNAGDASKGLDSFRSIDSLSSGGMVPDNSSSLASISSNNRTCERIILTTSSPPAGESSETITLDTFRPDISSQGASGVYVKTSESSVDVERSRQSENSMPSNSMASRRKSPPRWSEPSKAEVLEMPSPTPLRPSLLGMRHQSSSIQSEVEVSCPESFQGLDDFLSVVGQQELYEDMKSASGALQKQRAQSVNEIVETNGWHFILDHLFEASSRGGDGGGVEDSGAAAPYNPLLTDERILGDLVGNMAYLTALELNDSRCDRYSQKLGASIKKYSFDKLSYKVDLWTLNCENRATAVERINQLVKAKRSIAMSLSERMWENEFMAETKTNIMRMTLVYLKRMMETLKEYRSFLDEREKSLTVLSGIIEAERAKKETHDQIVERWKYTIEHYRERKGEALGREEIVKKKLTVWNRELTQLKDVKERELRSLSIERLKKQRMAKCLAKLNLLREASLFVQDWSPLDIVIDTKTSALRLIFNTAIRHLRCSNPYTVVDSAIWPDTTTTCGADDAPGVLADSSAALRKQIIKAGCQTAKPIVDAILLSLSPWSVVIKLKKAAMEHLMLGDLIIQPLTVNAVIQQLLSHEIVHKPPTLTESVSQLYVALLSALGCCATDLIAKAISPECKSVDLIGGLMWGLLCNVEKIAMEVIGLWWEYSAYKRVNGCLTVHNSPTAPAPEIIGGLDPSTKFTINLYRSEGAWTAIIRLPLACKSGIDVLVMDFDLSSAIKAGNLASGYRGLHGLQTVGNALKSEVRKRVRENTHKSTLTTFAHGCGVRDALQALMPLLAKR